MFHIPGYKLVHQGFRCTKHGGLIVYVNEKYSYKLRNLYDKSDVWECLFIDVNGHTLEPCIDLPMTITITKTLKSLQTKYLLLPISSKKKIAMRPFFGDFNINLLQVNEREICRIFRPDVYQQLFPKNNSSNTHCKTIVEFDWSDIL